jgi:hypothetical protein
MKQLPLFRRMIFVDWHGVVSNDPFWNSILTNETHPVRARLKTKLGQLFGSRDVANSWMRGHISSQEVISLFRLGTGIRFGDDFMAARLARDCGNMVTDQSLLRTLARLRPMIPLFVATDNMDCFSRAFVHARSKRRKVGVERHGAPLSAWARICDGIICSSDVGVLKAEDPRRFFGPTLQGCGLDFSDALLIDDRADNCNAFRALGGEAIQWKTGDGDVERLAVSIYSWLGWDDTPNQIEVRPTQGGCS